MQSEGRSADIFGDGGIDGGSGFVERDSFLLLLPASNGFSHRDSPLGKSCSLDYDEKVAERRSEREKSLSKADEQGLHS